MATRAITSKESLKFLTGISEKFPHLNCNLSNHKKTWNSSDTYQITVDKLSMDFLDTIKKSRLVKLVYFNPLMGPDGYGINMRYRLYIEYNKKSIRSRTTKKAEK
jgi:hypothetical protein